jgi:hypothetical protein
MLQSVLNFISSIVFGIAATFGINRGIEQARYDVIERIGDAIEIRQYPERTRACAVQPWGAVSRHRRVSTRATIVGR